MDSLLEGMKRCSKCGDQKPATLEYWYKHSTTKDRLMPECKPCHCAARRAYIDANKSAHAKRQLDWRQRNKEAVRAKRRQHYLENKEAVNAQNRAYYRANPEVSLSSWQRRRARLKGIPGEFTPLEFAAKLALYKNKCHWCGRKIEGTPHADHLIPINPKDGKPPGTNDISNIVPSCARCNKAKCNHMPWEFMPGRLL